MERGLDGASETSFDSNQLCDLGQVMCSLQDGLPIVIQKKEVDSVISSTFPHSAMPSSLALCHQILKTSH